MKSRIPYVFLAISLIIAILLTGCTGAAGSNGEQIMPGNSEGKDEVQSEPENSSFLPLEALVSPDQKFTEAGTDEGAYIRLTRPDYSEVLAYIDYNSRTGVPLCSQANCTHSDDTCTAWLPSGWNTQFMLNGKLYVLLSAGMQGSVLLEMEPNGQGRREVLRLESGQEFVLSGMAGNADYLFFGVVTYNQDGSSVYSVQRMELASGAVQEIYSRPETSTSMVTILGVYGEKLVVQYVDLAGVVQDSNAAFESQVTEVYCIDQNGTPTQDPVFSCPQANTSMNYAGSCLYLLNWADGSLTICDFSDGSETTFQDDRLRSGRMSSVAQALPEGLIISVEKEDMSQYPDWYLYHNGTLSATQYALLNEADSRVKNRVVAEVGDSYLVQRSYNSSAPQYSLVTKENFWADANTNQDTPIQMQLPW